MKQRGTRRKTRPRVESRLPLPPSLVILCTKTDEAHARVVTPIIRRGRIGKSARRVALRILSLSNRGSDSLRSLRRIYVVADCSSSSPTIVARIYWKVPLFFFFHSRVPLSSMSSMSFQRRSLKIRTKMNWYVFPRFLIFERENGRSWRIRERESAFRFIFPIDIGHCCAGMNLIIVSVYAC